MTNSSPLDNVRQAEELESELETLKMLAQMQRAIGLGPSKQALPLWVKTVNSALRLHKRQLRFYKTAFWAQFFFNIVVAFALLSGAKFSVNLSGISMYFQAQAAAAGQSPTRSEVITYIQQESPDTTNFAEYLSSICWTESRFRQYKWEDGFPVLINQNYMNGEIDSTDWGICQINDKYHPDAFPAAKDSWQTNVKTGIGVFGDCWIRYQTDVERLGCYNGFGEGYTEKVMAVYDTQFWNGKDPWGVPLPHGYELVRKLHDSDVPGWDYSWPGHPTSQQFPIPVYATLSGTASTFVDGVGNPVIVIQNDLWEVGYLHMDRLDLDNGQKVVWGQEIGIMGNIGKSDFTHLHYWIRNLQTGEFVRDQTSWYIP